MAPFLNRERRYLKMLKMETVKEMIYTKINSDAKIILDMNSINSLSENDCMEYNNMYNKDMNIPHFLVLADTQKSKLALSVLNQEQRNIVYDVLDKISCSFNISGVLTNPIACLIDAPSGTGKSFLIDCLYLTMQNTRITIVARTKTLLKSICTIHNAAINIKTTCKFIMETFLMEYNEAINVFKDIENIDAMEEKLQKLMNAHKLVDVDLLILDEYSMESPIFLILLILVCKLNKVNVLIMGDSKQQNTLSPSVLHQGSNYTLLQNFPNLQLYNLNEQMRIKDDKLMGLIACIKRFIDNGTCESNGNVRNRFILKFMIFTQLHRLWLNKGDILQTIYLTDTHVNIKTQAMKMIKYAQHRNIRWKMEPFEVINNDQRIAMILPENEKFLPGLVLIEGCKYLYDKRTFVTLTSIQPDHLVVKVDRTQEPLRLMKIPWTKQNHECVDVNFKWIMDRAPETSTQVLQYPLRMCLFTHYFVQGLTFSTQKVVIDIDATYANSLYVAFSRITNIEQILQLQSEDFMSCLYTMYKNDGFLYRIPKPSERLLANLKQYFIDKYYTFQEDSKFAPKLVPQHVFERRKLKVNCKIPMESNINENQASGDVSNAVKRTKTALEERIWRMYQSLN